MKIFSQIPKIMADVGAIEKGRKNTQQNYSFRGIDDLYLALQGPLHKHGVFFAPTVISHQREERPSKSGGVLIYTVLTVKYTFYADDGSNFEVTTVGEAMDSGDKSANKAMSSALKYALLELFCIPTEEEKDTEYGSPEPKFNQHTAKNNQPGPDDGYQSSDKPSLPKPKITPNGKSGAKAPKLTTRDEANRVLMNLYRPYLTQFPDTQFAEFLTDRYGVGETRLMTVEQMNDLISHMETAIGSSA